MEKVAVELDTKFQETERRLDTVDWGVDQLVKVDTEGGESLSAAKLFPLKTELVAMLAAENIHAEHLVFRDSLDLATIKNLQLVLVDHNVLTEEDKELESKVEIIDHHVRETDLENSSIEPVGSCTSLVLRKILSENPSFQDHISIRMVMKTILLDTVELQPSAKSPRKGAAVQKVDGGKV
jgi:inorganic pyrophosphatase/exopolyphosphatase